MGAKETLGLGVLLSFVVKGFVQLGQNISAILPFVVAGII
jgi:hypothetical protein